MVPINLSTRNSSLRLSLIALVLLSGCGQPIHVPLRAENVMRPALDPMPFVVGVHYPDGFRSAIKLTPQVGSRLADPLSLYLQGTTWEYPYGKNSVALMDASFNGLFKKVVGVEHWPAPSQRTLEVSGVLVPEAVNIDIRQAGRGPNSYVKARYIVSLYSLSGSLVKFWHVSSSEILAQILDNNVQLGEAIQAAMTEAVAQLVSTFLEQRDQFNEWLSAKNQ
jgi:hypothetical protein